MGVHFRFCDFLGIVLHLVKSLSETNKYRNKKCLQLSTWAPRAAYHPWSKLPGGPCLLLESGGDLKDMPNSSPLRMNEEHTRLKCSQSGMPKRPSKRRLPTERACFHWLQQLELRFQRIFKKKKRRKKRLYTSCLVSRAFPRHEEPKVDQKSQKNIFGGFWPTISAENRKKKEGKTRLAALLWLAQPKKQTSKFGSQ